MRVLLMKFGMRPVAAAMALVSVLAMVGCASNNSSTSGGNGTATPTFSPGAGTYNASQTVTIADTTQGAVLYCTTDGTTPTTTSPVCSQPTIVFKSEFLQAIAVAPGKSPSPAASAGYTINLNAAATPTFSPSGGTFTGAQTVTISDKTPGANIYYTLDGSVPTANSTPYTVPVTISKGSTTTTTTLSAIAVVTGFANSGVNSAIYTINAGTTAPVISPAGGTFASAQTVTITDATPGAAIFYTLDGSQPSASSPSYTGPITVSSTETISAIAIAAGTSSTVTTAAFTVTLPSAAAPTFNPSGGAFTTSQTVTLSDTTPGASIYYTTTGGTPTTSSTPYTGPITVSSNETINAIAAASGFANSTMASASYTFTTPATAPPTFTPGSGTITSGATVALADATSGASIFYTLDGSTPSASSTPYTAPIAMTTLGSVTIKAVAVASGNSSSVATATYTVNAAGPTLTGTVVSGTLPVSGAQVQMYAAGQTGYGSAATPVGSPVSTATDGTGTFTLSLSCSPSDLVYLVATGGNTGSGSSNAGLALMTALGSCGTLSATTPVVVNEVTTVASAYALSPFMTTAPNVGSTPSNILGLTNAFKAVNNLVDIATGQARSVTPAYDPTITTGVVAAPLLNSSTVPQARINTLANVLNICAATGGGCSSLFSATTVASAAPANTLQAILNIAQNPGNNASMVFNVAPTGPFSPVLQGAPQDWTLALTFTGGGLGVAPGTIGTTSAGIVAGPVLNTGLAIDATGNLWVTAYGNWTNGGICGACSSTTGAMLAKFDNLGAPLTPATTATTGATPVVTYGGWYDPSLVANTLVSPYGIAIDQTGNIWFGSGPKNYIMAEISNSFAVLQSNLQPWLTGNFALTVDSAGSVWIGGDAGAFTGGLDEYSSDGSENLNVPYLGWTGVPSTAYPAIPQYLNLAQLVFDSNGNLWGEDNNGNGDLYLINQTDGTITYDPFYYLVPTSGPITPLGQYTPLVADGSGNIYGCGTLGGQSLNVINATSQSIVNSYPISTGRGCGGQMAVDGAGHLFAVSGGTAPGIIDEFTTTGTLLSPASGFTGTSSGEAPTINPDPSVQPRILVNATGIGKNDLTSGVEAVAIDGSGNLWVLNADTGFSGTYPDASTGTPAGTPGPSGNVLVEYIGLAAPVVTPISSALQFAQIGARP